MADETKKYELAEADYMSGMKYKDIAKKHRVSLATVKSWKTRYGWDRKGKSAKRQKGMYTKSDSDAQEKETVNNEVTTVMENTELTDKQRLFCVLYTRFFNVTKAYQKAYGVDYKTVASIAYRMMENDGVKEEIGKLKRNRLNREMLSEEDIVQMYIDILYADISDYVDAKHNMISLSDHMDLATKKQKAEIELIKAKVKKENADGAIQSGKTLCMSLSFVIWAIKEFDGQNFGMCGKTIGSFRRNVLFWLKLMLKLRGYGVKDHRTDNLFIITKNGKTNYFYIFGGKDELSQDLIQGITLAGCFFDEVVLMPQSFVNQAIGCCSVDGSKF